MSLYFKHIEIIITNRTDAAICKIMENFFKHLNLVLFEVRDSNKWIHPSLPLAPWSKILVNPLTVLSAPILLFLHYLLLTLERVFFSSKPNQVEPPHLKLTSTALIKKNFLTWPHNPCAIWLPPALWPHRRPFSDHSLARDGKYVAGRLALPSATQYLCKYY